MGLHVCVEAQKSRIYPRKLGGEPFVRIGDAHARIRVIFITPLVQTLILFIHGRVTHVYPRRDDLELGGADRWMFRRTRYR